MWAWVALGVAVVWWTGKGGPKEGTGPAFPDAVPPDPYAPVKGTNKEWD